MNAQEVQSARIARILHDDVNQVLSAAGLHLDLIRMEHGTQVPELTAKTAEVQNLLGQVMEQLRELSYEINPAVVERVGLVFALERLAERLRRQERAPIRQKIEPRLGIPLRISSSLYRIAEAALDNSVRYSGAKRVDLILRGTSSTVRLEVRDDGCGFDVAQPAVCGSGKGLGMALMRHHAALAGGALNIESSGQGTIVSVIVRDWE
jgi:two-component system NarL family sensor kinase